MKLKMELKKISFLALLISSLLFITCNKDEDTPAVENDQEVITDVKLIFTNIEDDTDVVEATAKDPDGIGIKPLTVNRPINLKNSATYTLTYEIENNLTIPGEDIKEEIEEEKNDHQLFYGFTNNIFASPASTGNIGNSAEGVTFVNYNDLDGNGRPVGLNTSWVTGSSIVSGGKFKVKLQHQPDGIKTSTSGSNDGDTDFELEFDLNIGGFD